MTAIQSLRSFSYIKQVKLILIKSCHFHHSSVLQNQVIKLLSNNLALRTKVQRKLIEAECQTTAFPQQTCIYFMLFQSICKAIWMEITGLLISRFKVLFGFRETLSFHKTFMKWNLTEWWKRDMILNLIDLICAFLRLEKSDFFEKFFSPYHWLHSNLLLPTFYTTVHVIFSPDPLPRLCKM